MSKTGTKQTDGRVICKECGNLAKNERGHTLHWVLKHGKGRKVKKAYKKEISNLPARAIETGPSIMTIEAPGEISGQKFILTVDLSIAATGIRPC